MTTIKHKKRGDLTKAINGRFGFNEITILGATDNRINQLYGHLESALDNRLKLAFADKNYKEQQNSVLLDQSDLILVNGNHYKTDKQIVLIDSNEKNSLKEKLDLLSDVKLILLDDGETEVFDFLKAHLSYYGTIQVLRTSDIEGIAAFLLKEYNKVKPKVKGLVLAGGKSTRMGEDKTKFSYHNKPQVVHAADLLSGFCEEVYISTTGTRAKTGTYKNLKDTFIGLGPFGGILSAFRDDPNSAWFTLASDIPLISQDTLELLIKQRNSSKYATCFLNENTQLPEPLITIWEPKAYQRMLYFLSLGHSSPSKVLLKSDVEILKLEQQEEIFNVNTPEDFEKAKQIISQKP